MNWSFLLGWCQIVLLTFLVSNCPPRPLGVKLSLVSNCPRCQIVRGVKLSHHRQIVNCKYNIPSFPIHFQPANAALLKSDKLCQSLALDGQRGRKQLLRAWRPINPPFLEIRKGRPFQDNNKFLIVTLIMVFALTNEEIDSSMCCTFFAPLEGPAGSL